VPDLKSAKYGPDERQIAFRTRGRVHVHRGRGAVLEDTAHDLQSDVQLQAAAQDDVVDVRALEDADRVLEAAAREEVTAGAST
jgi:hypothetical protein